MTLFASSCQSEFDARVMSSLGPDRSLTGVGTRPLWHLPKEASRSPAVLGVGSPNLTGCVLAPHVWLVWLLLDTVRPESGTERGRQGKATRETVTCSRGNLEGLCRAVRKELTTAQFLVAALAYAAASFVLPMWCAGKLVHDAATHKVRQCEIGQRGLHLVGPVRGQPHHLVCPKRHSQGGTCSGRRLKTRKAR
jgi:hypothetical protein